MRTSKIATYGCKFNKNGNIKIGNMYSFSKLAGNGVLAGCKGTCGEHCKGCYNPKDPKKSPCYVFRSYLQYGWENSTPVKSHVRNTEAIRKDLEGAFAELALQLKRAKNKPRYVRIHASGELETANELRAWFNLARQFPAIGFYVYTKASDILDEVLSDTVVPKNFTILVSIWHENGIDTYNKWKHIKQIKAYVYDDKYDYNNLDLKVHCPAYDEKGKMDHSQTCEKCRLCIDKPTKVIACYDH